MVLWRSITQAPPCACCDFSLFLLKSIHPVSLLPSVPRFAVIVVSTRKPIFCRVHFGRQCVGYFSTYLSISLPFLLAKVANHLFSFSHNITSQHSSIHSPPLGTRCSACFLLQKLTLIYSLIYEMELNFACGERRDETPTVGSMRKWVRDNRTSGLLRPSQPLRPQNPRFASMGGSPFHRVVMRSSGSCRLPHGSEMRHTRNRCPEFLTTDFADPLMVLRVVHEERDRAII